MNPPYRLYTFSLSHFSEKIRWALDLSRIAYAETRWTPFFHILPARIKSGRSTTVPILQTPRQTIQDSTEILLWLEREHAPFALMPAASELRQQVLEIEERFDKLGRHFIRYLYATALTQRERMIRLWTLDANPVQRAVVAMSYPLLAATIRRVFAITPENVSRSEQKIQFELDWLAERIAGGQRFLAGNTLTAADITAAALLAPLACPAEHPVYGSDDYRASVASLRARFKDAPALAWVRAIYRDFRQPAA